MKALKYFPQIEINEIQIPAFVKTTVPAWRAVVILTQCAAAAAPFAFFFSNRKDKYFTSLLHFDREHSLITLIR